MKDVVKIPLRIIEVDRGIKNIVEWLNSFFSVQTLYSCQGCTAKDPMIMATQSDEEIMKTDYHSFLPYVSFTCNNFYHLEVITKCIQCFCDEERTKKNTCISIRTEMDYCESKQCLRYLLTLNDIKYADELVNYYFKSYKPRLEAKIKDLP